MVPGLKPAWPAWTEGQPAVPWSGELRGPHCAVCLGTEVLPPPFSLTPSDPCSYSWARGGPLAPEPKSLPKRSAWQRLPISSTPTLWSATRFSLCPPGPPTWSSLSISSWAGARGSFCGPCVWSQSRRHSLGESHPSHRKMTMGAREGSATTRSPGSHGRASRAPRSLRDLSPHGLQFLSGAPKPFLPSLCLPVGCSLCPFHPSKPLSPFIPAPHHVLHETFQTTQEGGRFPSCRAQASG